MRRLPPEVEAEILRLRHVEHWKVGTISEQLHVHHQAIRRILGMMPARPPRKPDQPHILKPYEDFIQETLAQYPRLRATRLYDMLRERGFQGSTRQVRRYVAMVRPTPPPQAFLHIETLAGEQAQVDWAHAGKIHVQGGVRDLWLFVLVLSHSRAMFAEFVLDLSVHSLLRSLVRASETLGGVPRQWLFDNPKVVVLERTDNAARFHPLLLDLCGKMRVQPRLCQVRAPHHKGKVERTIRYLRDRFLAGRTISSVPQGNQLVNAFIADVAHARPHPTIAQKTVGEVLEEERPRLLPLPASMPVTDHNVIAQVSTQAFVQFDTNFYSVPSELAGKSVTLCMDDQSIRVLWEEEPVAIHPRCFGRNQRRELPEHRRTLLAQRKRARQSKGHDRLRVAVPDIQQVFDAWVEDGINVGFATIRVLHLLDLYGPEVLGLAVKDLLARESHDVSALSVRCEIHRRAQGRPVPMPVRFAAHVQERDVIQHPLESYDDDDTTD